jgi:hypothetical protein
VDFKRARSVVVVVAALASPALTSSAMAGDPCPIAIAVVDLGVPDWASPELRAKVKDGDPLLDRVVQLARKLECSDVSLHPPTDGAIPVALYEKVDASKMTVAHVKSLLVDKKRQFRCDQAARDLAYLKATEEPSGMLLHYRGHSRILLVSPGWKSLCVSSAQADKMTDKQLVALWKRVTGPLVKDRHDNP